PSAVVPATVTPATVTPATVVPATVVPAMVPAPPGMVPTPPRMMPAYPRMVPTPVAPEGVCLGCSSGYEQQHYRCEHGSAQSDGCLCIHHSYSEMHSYRDFKQLI